MKKYDLDKVNEIPIKVEIDHEIKLINKDKIIYLRPYRRSPEENDFITEEVNRLLENKIIRKSTS